MIRHRARQIPFKSEPGVTSFGQIQSGTGARVNVTVQKNSLTGKQYTVSESHPWRGDKPLLVDEDVGGAFSTYRSWCETKSTKPDYVSSFTKPGTGAGYFLEGPQFAHSSQMLGQHLFVAGPSTAQQLDALGSTAISRCIPTNPVAGAAVFLGELREGLPSVVGSGILKSRAKGLRANRRAAGSEYLNVEFGWKPIISDVKKAVKATRDTAKILEQLERDSGKNVRRRYAFPMITESVTEVLPTNSLPNPVGATSMYTISSGDPTRKSLTKTVQRRIWFSGAFTYYLETGQSDRERMERNLQEANKLYGVKLTPEVLWNLAPWSWAADWFSNAGDVIHNISQFAQDGLVMRYGYVMEETIVKHTYTLSNVRYRSSPGPHSFVQTFGIHHKVRRKATPFGFGVSYDGLSSRQLGIIAALGMSRGRK